MKKLITFTILIMLCLSLCACADTATEPTDATEQSSHTLPAAQTKDEPEWCNIDCDINLVDGDAIYISAEDFDTFALIGSNDTDCALRIKLSDNGADMLKSFAQSDMLPKKLTLIVNGDSICDVALDESTIDGEFDIKGNLTFEELCELSNTIRGLV